MAITQLDEEFCEYVRRSRFDLNAYYSDIGSVYVHPNTDGEQNCIFSVNCDTDSTTHKNRYIVVMFVTFDGFTMMLFAGARIFDDAEAVISAIASHYEMPAIANPGEMLKGKWWTSKDARIGLRYWSTLQEAHWAMLRRLERELEFPDRDFDSCSCVPDEALDEEAAAKAEAEAEQAVEVEGVWIVEYDNLGYIIEQSDDYGD